MVAHRVRRVDAVEADAGVAAAHMVGRAFAGFRHQHAQRRQHHPVERERRLVDRMQARCLRADRIAPVVQALHPLRMLQRGQQAQHRAFVEARALGQLGQAQRRIADAKRGEQAQGAVDGGDTAICGIGIGNGFGQGFAGHGGNSLT
ncbi:hypothetical protein D3C71_1715150 [compost metagenome]